MRTITLGLLLLTCVVSAADAGTKPALHAAWSPNLGGLALTGVAADDAYVYVSDRWGIQKFTHEGTFVARFGGGVEARDIVTDGSGVLTILDVRANRIVQLDSEGRLLRHWSNEGALCAGIAVDPAGRIYQDLRPPGVIRISESDGTPVSELHVGGRPAGVAEGGDIFLFDTYHRQVQRVSGSGVSLGAFGEPWPAKVSYLLDLAIDGQNRVYVTENGRVYVFSEGDTLLTTWDDPASPEVMATAPGGRLVIASSFKVEVYEPLPYIATPPPPPPPVRTPSTMLLHIAALRDNACGTVPGSPDDIVTAAPVAADGTARYIVYLLATPGSIGGLAGFQMGLTYDASPEPGTGIEVTSWGRCSDLDFPQDSWPQSGSGNTVTWAIPIHCQRGPFALAGYLEVIAYSPSIMSIVDYSVTGKVKLADCGAAELILEHDVEPPQIGWVSFGGMARGTDTNGCNPLLAPCAGTTVPVRDTTWGRLKTLYH